MILADSGLGGLILIALLVGAALFQAWAEKRKEMLRRRDLSREQRAAAERKPGRPQHRELVVEDKRALREAPSARKLPTERTAPPRPRVSVQGRPQVGPQVRPQARPPRPPAPWENPMRELARQLGIPEEILPPPPRTTSAPPPSPEQPRPRAQQPPAGRSSKPRRPKAASVPAATAPTEGSSTPEITPAEIELLRFESPETSRTQAPRHPFVFSDNPVVNAIVVSEVLMTPAQRARLRSMRRW